MRFQALGKHWFPRNPGQTSAPSRSGSRVAAAPSEACVLACLRARNGVPRKNDRDRRGGMPSILSRRSKRASPEVTSTRFGGIPFRPHCSLSKLADLIKSAAAERRNRPRGADNVPGCSAAGSSFSLALFSRAIKNRSPGVATSLRDPTETRRHVFFVIFSRTRTCSHRESTTGCMR